MTQNTPSDRKKSGKKTHPATPRATKRTSPSGKASPSPKTGSSQKPRASAKKRLSAKSAPAGKAGAPAKRSAKRAAAPDSTRRAASGGTPKHVSGKLRPSGGSTKRMPARPAKKETPSETGKTKKISRRLDLPTNLSGRIKGLDKVIDRETRRETQRSKFGKNVAIHTTERLEENRKKGAIVVGSVIAGILIVFGVFWSIASVMSRASDANKLEQIIGVLDGVKIVLPRVCALWNPEDVTEPQPLNESSARNDMIRYVFSSELKKLESVRTRKNAGTEKQDDAKKRMALNYILRESGLKDTWGNVLIVDAPLMPSQAKAKMSYGVNQFMLKIRSLGPDGVDNTDDVIAFFKEHSDMSPSPISEQAGPTDEHYRIYRQYMLNQDKNFKAYDIQVSSLVTSKASKTLLKRFHADVAEKYTVKAGGTAVFGKYDVPSNPGKYTDDGEFPPRLLKNLQARIAALKK